MSNGFKDVVVEFNWLIAALGTGVLVWIDTCAFKGHGVTSMLHDTKKDVYVALATIFGALLGFVITAYSIVVSLNDSAVLKRLRKRGSVGRVLAVFTTSVYIIGFATLISLVAIFVDSNPAADKAWVEYSVFGVSTWAALAVLGVLFLIEALLDAINRTDADDGPDRAAASRVSAP